ncbi:uncharacterized protein LOC142565822 [Dermacentor variabilis]|uniref:uncharacterized protein LOC142565822 n=1 Tax=Dermacentor variabilis TaxID=34621 RepID=UPI003F5B1A27
MPPMPKEEAKIVVRPWGGLCISKCGPTAVADAIWQAAGLDSASRDTDTMCPNFQQNIMVISKPNRNNAARYVGIEGISVAGQRYEGQVEVKIPVAIQIPGPDPVPEPGQQPDLSPPPHVAESSRPLLGPIWRPLRDASMTSWAGMSGSDSPPREPEPPPECSSSTGSSASPLPAPHQYRFGLHNDLGNFTAKPPKLYPETGEPSGGGGSGGAAAAACPASASLPTGRSPAPLVAVQSTPTPPPSEDHLPPSGGGSLPLSASCHSLTAATTGSSLGSSINDLTLEAEQLERAIRANDVAATRRLLELHHGRFSVNLHGSLLDKSSAGSASQDMEILLRKSQTLIDRFGRGDSVSTDLEPVPAVFASALHLAVEHQALDVVGLLLKYGVEPNEAGVPLGSLRRGSSAASEASGSLRRATLSPRAAGHSPEQAPSPELRRRKYVPLRPELAASLRVVRYSPDGREITFEEEYTRDFLYSLPPLFLAAALGRTAAARLLLKYGAAASPRDKNGVTPLHLAACQPQPPWPCLRLLLEAGARIHTANLRGATPCDLAESDLSAVQISLVEAAFAGAQNAAAAAAAVLQTATPGASNAAAAAGAVPAAASSVAPAAPPIKQPQEESHATRSNILRRLQDSRPGQTHRGSARKKEPPDELAPSPDGPPPSGRQRSPGVLTTAPDEDKTQERVPSAEPQSSKLNRRKSGDDGRLRTKCNTPSAEEVEPASQKVDASLAALTRMAHNPECLDSILSGLQRHLGAIIELTLLVDGDRLQRPLAALFNRILLVSEKRGCLLQGVLSRPTSGHVYREVQ